MTNRQVSSVSQMIPSAYIGLLMSAPEPKAQAETRMRAMPNARRRSMGVRGYRKRCPGRALAGPFGRTLRPVTSVSERPVAERLPSVVDAPLKLVNRRLPLTVPPGTSLADCLRSIQRSGVGDSVLVVGSGRSAGRGPDRARHLRAAHRHDRGPEPAGRGAPDHRAAHPAPRRHGPRRHRAHAERSLPERPDRR